MHQQKFAIRNAAPAEFGEIGELMVAAYSQLEGFPKPDEEPGYYKMLANIGDLTQKPATELLVAVSPEGKIAGALVFFGDLQHYGTKGAVTSLKNASAFRLLAVDSAFRGLGVGRLLTLECIQKARDLKHEMLVLHTTRFMQAAWKMYEKIGFERYQDIDFSQGELQVYGFKMML